MLDKNTAQPETINISINTQTLARALSSGNICACDVKGLDVKAKQSLWRCCLEACISRR